MLLQKHFIENIKVKDPSPVCVGFLFAYFFAAFFVFRLLESDLNVIVSYFLFLHPSPKVEGCIDFPKTFGRPQKAYILLVSIKFSAVLSMFVRLSV